MFPTLREASEENTKNYNKHYWSKVCNNHFFMKVVSYSLQGCLIKNAVETEILLQI